MLFILINFAIAVFVRMLKAIKYILALLFFLVISSCIDSKKNIGNPRLVDTPLKENRIEISRLNPKNNDINLIQQRDVQLYENTTYYNDKTFGEITGIRLDGLKNHKEAQIEIELIPRVEATEIKVPLVKKTGWQISLYFANDIFANRDYYFTNGLKLEVSAPFMNSSPINKILIGSKNYNLRQSGLSIVQNIYTPTNPDTAIILYGDRPFSAYLSLGQFSETYNFIKKLHIKSEISIGVIGPSSYGGQVQSSIHEIEPEGWPNQINNDIVIDYSVVINKGIVSSPNFELNAKGNANIGTLYNKAGGGLNMRLGNFMPVYKGPFSVFENKNPGGRYQFWFFAEGVVNVIGFDATLQGGMFNKENPYVITASDINRLVFQGSFGFALYYNSIGIEYEHLFMTPEFNGAKYFSWGELKAVIAF